MGYFEDRKKMSWEGWFYAIQRIDLLIIAISGTGIYVALETLKYINDNSLVDSGLIKYAGVFLLFAIIVNFLSQFSVKKANELDIEWCELNLDYKKPSTEEQKKINKADNLSECYTTCTNWLNLISLILMFIGLGLIMFYFLINF